MTTWMRQLGTLGLIATLAVTAGACAARERTRPVRMGPVDTGTGSLEAVRRQFEGTWALERVEVPDARGTLVSLKASGGMKMDAYGNIEVRGVLEEPLPGTSGTGVQLVEYGGRLVIDVQKSVFRLQAPEAAASIDKALIDKLDPALERKYTFQGPDRLTIAPLDATGKPTAITHFRKVG